MNAAQGGEASAPSLAHKFFHIFAGLMRSYGRYTVPAGAKPDEEGKIKGKALTIHEPLTVELWEQHLAGALGLGVVPINDDAVCVFGAIDVDIYPLDLVKLVARTRDLGLPVIVCRTKSGGAHIYLFLREPVPAAVVRSKLKEWAVALGHKPQIEIFPKQDRLDSKKAYGNWINIPYAGGARSTRYALKPDGSAMTPEEFVLTVEHAAITAAELEAFELPEDEELDDLFEGAPPCLQALAKRGFGDWGNNSMFNIGVYLKKRYEDDWAARMEQYNQLYMKPPLSPRDLSTVIKSLNKKTYSYMCKQEPIASVCNRQVCLTCEFGIVRRGARYVVIDDALHFLKPSENIPIPVKLCNFAARIEEDQKVDDGVTVARYFRLAGSLQNGGDLPAINVPVKQLTGPWWLEKWGAAVAVVPLFGTTHLMSAIQATSDPLERVVYAHLGWRKIDERWLYLHAGGAIGASGPIDGFNVEPGGELTHYTLPAIRDLKAAIIASLGFFDAGPAGIALAAAAYRAPLGEFNEIATSLFIAGASGVFKSALAGAAQAHWGAHWNGKSFPGNWSATANFLEKQAFVLKDSMFVVDDFAPKGTGYDVAKLHQGADRLLRAQGNRGGRGRMNADGTLKETFWPRGIVVATGEDVPTGQSLRARMYIVHVAANDIDQNKLTALQLHAAEGRFAEAMAGYVQFIAKRADELPELLDKRMIELRDAAHGEHKRTGDNFASLMIGVEQFLTFAKETGAIDANTEQQLLATARNDLGKQIETQDAEQHSEKPAERFKEMIGAALQAGRAHLAQRDGTAPTGREAACGWRERKYFNKDAEEQTYWSAFGDCLGWIEDDDLWLNPAASYACAEKFSREQNRSLGVTDRTLGKQLAEAGWLRSKEDGKQTIRLRIKDGLARGFFMSALQFLPNVPPPKSDNEGLPSSSETQHAPGGEADIPM